jgi:hypothetical protein
MPNKVNMEMHNINEQNNFISGWYIDPSLCDDIIDAFEQHPELHYSGVLGSPPKLDKDKKDSLDCHLENFLDLRNKYVNMLQQCVDLYIEKYCFVNEGDPWTLTEAINIQKYKPAGGFHKWHCERGSFAYPNSSRHLVFMTYLNDVEDEGETEFYYQKLKVKPEKGLTLIWPVDWTFTHRGVASKTQTKYITTGWFNFVEKI